MEMITVKQYGTNDTNFIGPVPSSSIDVIKQSKKTSSSYKDYDIFSDPNNPLNKVDEYASKGSTDSEILNDINKYNSDNNISFSNSENITILNTIKNAMKNKKMEQENPVTIRGVSSEESATMITFSEWEELGISTSELDKIQEKLLSSNYFTKISNGKIEVSTWKTRTQINLYAFDDISEEDKKDFSSKYNEILNARISLAKLENEYSTFSRLSGSVNASNALNGDTAATATITVDGKIYTYNSKELSQIISILSKMITKYHQFIKGKEDDLWKSNEYIIQETDAYKEFIKNLDIESYLEKNSSNTSASTDSSKKNTNIQLSDVNYEFMTLEEKQFYCYLYSVGGIDLAKDYISAKQESINQRAGNAKAIDFINSYRDKDGNLKEDFWSELGISASGFADGTAEFFENISYVFNDVKENSVEYYKRVAIAEYLSYESKLLGTEYSVAKTVGKSLPPYVGALIAYGVSEGNPAAAKATFKVMTALEVYGESKHKALNEGLGTDIAMIYAFLNASKSYAITSLVNSIPGLNNDSAGIVAAAFRNGIKTSAITTTGNYLDQAFLGKTIDMKDWSKDVVKSFLSGFIVGALDFGIEELHFIDGKVVTIDKETASAISKYLEEHEDTGIMTAIKIVAPAFYSTISKEVPEDILEGNI